MTNESGHTCLLCQAIPKHLTVESLQDGAGYPDMGEAYWITRSGKYGQL